MRCWRAVGSRGKGKGERGKGKGERGKEAVLRTANESRVTSHDPHILGLPGYCLINAVTTALIVAFGLLSDSSVT
jgi:hypothetical protein